MRERPDKRAGIGITRRALLRAAAIAGLAIPAAGRLRQAEAAAAPRQWWGVNLAGAEFGNLLGTHGTEYLYPTKVNVHYYAGLGFDLIRIPFKWERLQPDLGTPLDPAELSQLTGLVDYGRKSGLTVVLDPHNYAKRRLRSDGWSADFLIGSAEVPTRAFLDLWGRLADRFKGDDGIVFGLMNEPNGMPAAAWLDIVNGTIARIRTQGARNLLLIPGIAYTGAHSWISSGNAAMGGVKDPLGNFAYEVHQYFDRDSSGTHPEAASGTIGSERIAAFQSWAREHGVRAFLGEYNGARDPVSLRALMDLCDELRANPDVWLGSAAWAGGPRWPEDEMFNLQPYGDGRTREQTAIISSRATPGARRAYWAGATPTIYADFARDQVAGNARLASILRADNAAGGRTAAGAKGVPIGASGPEQPMLAGRDLAPLFDLGEFTILMEICDLHPNSAGCTLLSGDDVRLLYCGPTGVVGTDLGGGLVTASQSAGFWSGKRRCALSLRRATGEVAFGVTGARAVAGMGIGPFAAESTASASSRQIGIGAGAEHCLGGVISRIVGFPVFLEPDELAANLA